MIITVASYKGGVGKSTTAIHLACYLQRKAPTLLIDSDPNRSALSWARRGSLPFTVIDERQAARYVRDYQHVVIDTQARPGADDLRELAAGCNLLVLPTTPDYLALDALNLTTGALRQIGADNFRILLAIVPPKPNRDAEEARELMRGSGLPMFQGEIRRLIVFQRAALQGVPVYDTKDPRAADAWGDYEAVGKEISNGWKI